MKNFTNNFKQFTSRLSARWLIMALMLLVGTSSAWAANTTQSDGSYRLYFKFSGGSTWWNNSGCYHYAWVWANGGAGQVQKIYKVGTTNNASTGNTTDVFYMNIPNGMTLYGMILFRGTDAGPNNGSTTFPSSYHNKTNDIILPNNISAYNLVTAVTENSTSVTQNSRYTTVSLATTTLSASGFNSGSGTQADPYVYDENGTMELTASATIDDHNFTIQLAYGSSTATISSGGSKSIDVSLTTASSATAYTVTYTPLLGGSTSYKGTASTKTIYYKTAPSCTPADYTVSFANSATSVNKGSTLQASVSPNGDGYGSVTWSSSATGVATVSSTGLITGVKGGQATITATVAKGATYCGGSATKTITVKETPTVSISGEQEFCGASTTLTANVTGITNGVSYSIAWYKDGGATSVATGATYNASASGTYTAKVTGTYINTKTSAGYAVTKKTAPAKPTIQANKDIVDGTISLMSGESVTFSVPEIDGVTYTWYRGNNNNVHTGTTYTTNVNGSYTVKATNDCGEQISDAVSITVCEPISGLSWSITSGAKATYCPGDEVTVTMTYNGSTAKGYEWGGNYSGNIGISGGSIASGAQYTMTINKSGSVDLTLTGCNGATAKTSTLTFEVVEAPVKPTITFSANPVGQNKPTTLTVGEYNGTLNNYTLYKEGVSQGAYTTPQTITIGDVGEYDYHVVATSKACPSLTATSETVTLEVQEAGAKIVQLGDLTIYTNIKTDFVPMYVQKDGIVDIAGATSVKGYTWQYSQDGNSWSNCTTNYASGVVGMSNGGADCNNWRADKAGRYRCLITYDNDGTQYSNVLSVSAATTTAPAVNAFGDLPIISVNTGSNSFPSDAGLSYKTTKCETKRYPSVHADMLKAKISVDVKIYDKTGKLQYDRKARMNYRGSSSLNFQKKSYAFVTGKEKTKNNDGDVNTGKANLFGLSNGCEDKDWVLYAATPDPSMMRNRLVFDLYKQMRPGEWGVNSMYVELIVNNEYKGVYVLMDKITNNVDRVNITSSGGFIVKFDKTDVEDRVEITEGDQKTFATSRTGTKNSSNGIESYGACIDQRFEIEYPEKEDVEDAGGNWEATYSAIQKRFEDFETALEEKDYSTVRSIIDYDSWADWFILSEFIKNQDGFRASNIFIYDGGKIKATPLWDQELSMDNRTRIAHGSNNAEGLLTTTSSVYTDNFPATFWFTGNNGSSITGGLLKDPCFVSLVKSKWATYHEGILSPSNISGMVADYEEELGNAKTREATKWPYTQAVRGTTTDGDYVGYYSDGEGDPSHYSFAASKNAINSWATNRSTPLGENTNGLGEALYNLEGEALIFTVSPSTVVTTPWQQVILTVNAPEGYEYTVDYSELTAAGAIIKEGNNTYGIKIPRPDGWGTAGNGDSNDSEEYEFTANIEVSGENACGTMQDGTATSTITLKDVTEECSPEVKP